MLAGAESRHRSYQQAIIKCVCVAVPVLVFLAMRYDLTWSMPAIPLAFYCILLIFKIPYSSLVLLLVPLTALDPYQVLVRFRLTFSGIPFGLLDVGLLFVGFSLPIALSRYRFDSRDESSLPVPMVAFTGIVLISALWGIATGNASYQMLRRARALFSLVLVYIVTIKAVRENSQIRILLGVFVFGSTMAAVQEFYNFALSAPRFLEAGSLSVLRQTAFQPPFFSLVSLMLLGLLVHREASETKLWIRRIAPLVALINLAGILVTLNRGPWIYITICLVVSVILVRSTLRASMTKWVMLLVFSLMVFSVVFGLLLPQRFELGDLLSSRALSVFEDPTVPGQSFYSRLTGWRIELTAWRDGNPFLGRGLGFWSYEPYLANSAGWMGISHNSYLFYLVNMGPAGVIALIWLLSHFLRRSYTLYRHNRDLTAVLVSWTTMMAIIYCSMNAISADTLHDERVLPVLGLFFGLVTVCERPRSSSSRFNNLKGYALEGPQEGL